MKKSFQHALILISVLSTLSFAQFELEPAQVEMNVDLLPGEQLIRVHFAINLTEHFIDSGQFTFGIGEDYIVKKAFMGPGVPCEFSQSNGLVSVRVDTVENYLGNRLHIEYEGHPQSTSGRITYVGEDGCYFSWLGGWTPFFAGASGFVGNTSIRVPGDLVVASQGRLISKESENGCNLFKFRVDNPCYFSIMAAPYETFSKDVNGIEYRTYFLGGGKAKSEFYLERVSRIIKAISSYYGPFPYDYFSLIEAPEIEGLRIIGSSEQGMISLGSQNALDDYFNFSIIAHELGHMWFGNWVIGETYVISEGLAQLGHFLSAEEIYGEEVMRKLILYGTPDHFSSLHLYLTMFAELNRDEPTMQVMKYDYPSFLVIQGKGPVVFLMLRDLIGKEAFKDGFISAVKKYAHTRMTMDQLKEELEIASHKDLDGFFDQWIYKAGAPHLELSWRSERIDNNFLVKGKITQINEPFYSLPIELILKSEEGDSAHIIQIQGAESPIEIQTDLQPDDVVLDPQRKSLWFGKDDVGKSAFSQALSFQAGLQNSTELLRNYLAEEENDHLAEAWLAKRLLQSGQVSDEVVSILTDLVNNMDPDGELEIYYSWACFELAKIYAGKGNRDESRELLNKVLKLDRTKRYENSVNSLLNILQ